MCEIVRSFSSSFRCKSVNCFSISSKSVSCWLHSNVNLLISCSCSLISFFREAISASCVLSNILRLSLSASLLRAILFQSGVARSAALLTSTAICSAPHWTPVLRMGEQLREDSAQKKKLHTSTTTHARTPDYYYIVYIHRVIMT